MSLLPINQRQSKEGEADLSLDREMKLLRWREWLVTASIVLAVVFTCAVFVRMYQWEEFSQACQATMSHWFDGNKLLYFVAIITFIGIKMVDWWLWKHLSRLQRIPALQVELLLAMKEVGRINGAYKLRAALKALRG